MSELDPMAGAAKTTTRCAAEQGLTAQINVHYFRALELHWLRWLAAASIPLWFDVHWRLLPGLLAWLAFLGQGLCFALAVAHGGLARRWAQRAAQIAPVSPGFRIEPAWTSWGELRAALWYGVAAVSLVPWAYAGLDRTLPASLLPALTATAWTVLLLLGAAESLATVRPLPGTDGYSGTPAPPAAGPPQHHSAGGRLLRATT